MECYKSDTSANAMLRERSATGGYSIGLRTLRWERASVRGDDVDVSDGGAELRSAGTGGPPSPCNLRANVESPEVMLNSFLSASSSRLDPC